VNTSLLESLQRLQVGNPFAVLEEPFLLIAFFLGVLGFMFNVLAEKDDPLRAFVRVAVAALFIAAIPLWTGWVREGIYFLPYTLLEYHTSLAGIYRNITNAVNTALNHQAFEFSLFDALGSVLMDFVVVVMMRLIAGLGSMVAIPLLFVQIGVEKFLVATLPMAIAALTIPTLRNQAQGYIAFWVSVLLWPFFFAVVTIIAGFVFTVSDNLGRTWLETTVTGGIFANFAAPFSAGAILIGGVLSTPPLAYSLCAHGGAALTGPSPSLITFLR
jgi:hypothetical protein